MILTWVAQYNQWYCSNDRGYYPPQKSPPLPIPPANPTTKGSKRGLTVALVVVLSVFVILVAIGAAVLRAPGARDEPPEPPKPASPFPPAEDLGPGWSIAVTQFRCDGRERIDSDYVNTTVEACEDFEKIVKPNVRAWIFLNYLVWNTEADAHAHFESIRADINTGTIENSTVGDESFLHASGANRNAFARLGATILWLNMEATNLPFDPEPFPLLVMFADRYTAYRDG